MMLAGGGCYLQKLLKITFLPDFDIAKALRVLLTTRTLMFTLCAHFMFVSRSLQ